ncbi:MAG: hypothetical protein ACPG8W_07410 [Candidatus Promineifilaceae bacterium]
MKVRFVIPLLALLGIVLLGIGSAEAAIEQIELVGALEETASHAVLRGDYLYMVQESDQLVIVDVADSTNPIVVSRTDFTPYGGLTSVDVQDNLLVGIAFQAIHIVDITDKAAPNLIKTHNDDNISSTIALNYPYVYYGGQTVYTPSRGQAFGLRSIDITDTDNIVSLGFIEAPMVSRRVIRPPRIYYVPATVTELTFVGDQLFAVLHFPSSQVSSPFVAIERIDTSDPQNLSWEKIANGLGLAVDEGILYSVDFPSYKVFGPPQNAQPPTMSAYDVVNDAQVGGFADCTQSTSNCYFSRLISWRFTGVTVQNEKAYITTGDLLRIYDISESNFQVVSTYDHRILDTRDFAADTLLSNDTHLYSYDKDETLKIWRHVPEGDVLSMRTSYVPSRRVVPPSGGHVAFDVVVQNDSTLSLWQNPFRVTRYSADTVGEIAPNAQYWTTTCWWWLPELWPANSAACNHSTVAPSNAVGNQYASTVTVEATATDGQTLVESSTAAVLYREGPGVGNADYWENGLGRPSVLGSIYRRPLDLDGDGSRDAYGYLIGDTNLNGKCDHYEVWWTAACIPITTLDDLNLLDDIESSDERYTMMRALIAAWMNIESHNDYLCAQADTAVNLALLWLHRNAPDGKPNLGGDPISGAEWDAVSWNADWLNWYSETGGQNCAIDQDTGSRNEGRGASDFEPPAPADFDVTPTTLAAINQALSENTALNSAANSLYVETITLILSRANVPTDYLTRLESTFNQLVGTVDAAAASELQALWEQINPQQYANQSARSSWERINVASAPTAVALTSNTAAPTPLALLLTMLLTLVGTTVWVKRR